MTKKTERKSILHRASHHMLSTAGISVFGMLIVMSFAFTALIVSSGLLSPQFAAVVTSNLIDLTNQDRSQNGLGTLAVNPKLVAAAQAKANDMATKGYFAHVSPDGRTSWSWFQDAGYAFSYAGENLAVDFTDSGDVNQAWLNSPTHRANIMNGHYTEIGIATAEGEYEGHPTTFVVQMFGTPAKTQQAVVAAALPQNPTEPAQAKAERTSDVLGAATQPVQQKAVPAASAAASPTPVMAAQAPDVSKSSALSFLGSPRALLRDLYVLFGLLLLIALLFRTEFEFKLHHARHAIAVLVLIVGMSGLFVSADHFIFVPPVIGQGVSN